MKGDADPLAAANATPRCIARSKRTGKPCTQPAMRGKRVCHMHGGKGGSPAGPTHPNYKHGMRSREWVETRKAVNELAREARELEALIDADWDAPHILDNNSRVVS